VPAQAGRCDYNFTVASDHRYGISTHLFHERRLSREHLVDIAAHGFDMVELFATRTHFDYGSDAAVAELADWLSDTRLALHSVHAPVGDGFRRGEWIGTYSTASGDDTRRKHAVAEAAAALRIAERLPFRYLVVHLGVVGGSAPSDNKMDAARRSIEEIAALAAAARVGVALEVIPNSLSNASVLADLIEDFDDVDVGVCLDYGHAHMMGDLGEAIEALSGHLWTTHVHDNHGRRDDHLVPFAGNIDWDAAVMMTQKIGYEGAFMLEVGDTGDPIDVLRRAAKACERLESAFVTF
jgi:sugar phosphate isomerase/epimerase